MWQPLAASDNMKLNFSLQTPLSVPGFEYFENSRNGSVVVERFGNELFDTLKLNVWNLLHYS